MHEALILYILTLESPLLNLAEHSGPFWCILMHAGTYRPIAVSLINVVLIPQTSRFPAHPFTVLVALKHKSGRFRNVI